MNMNIQSGTAPLPAVGSALARGAPAPGTTGAQGSVPPQPPPRAVAAPLPSDAIRQVARQIDEYLKSSTSSLQVSVDNESDKIVVRIVDSVTQEVIRQIPSQEMLAISQSIDEMRGYLLQQKA
jgi:flagellar protein FlaG